MIELNVSDGIHRIRDGFVNWYLVEDEDGLTAVDAGLPRSWQLLHEAVSRLGRKPQDLKAVVLTHAHLDHTGFAERARRELGVPVWLHPADQSLARHPLFYRTERPLPLYLRRRSTRAILASSARSGALWARRTRETRALTDGETLSVPGRPRVVSTPGHTHGHVALHLPRHDVVIAGDALVTLDPYTGSTGPRLVARAATADTTAARSSLTKLAGIAAATLLCGHGEPWREGTAEAARLAASAGQA